MSQLQLGVISAVCCCLLSTCLPLDNTTERFSQPPEYVTSVRPCGGDGDDIMDVTQLDDIVYVICLRSPVIKMFTADKLSPLGEGIHVEEPNHLVDIVASRRDRQLYVADNAGRCIWRVSVSDGRHSNVKWLTENVHVSGMSLTSRHLLVMSWRRPATYYLRQHSTTDGQLLREVTLPGYAKYVGDAVETSRGTFVFGHVGTSQNERQKAVSEVDSEGRVLSTHIFTDRTLPWDLSLDSEGRVLVADRGYNTNRILLLNSQLQLQRVVIDNANSQGKLWHPKLVCYNELASQLYVAHASRHGYLRLDVVSLFIVR